MAPESMLKTGLVLAGANSRLGVAKGLAMASELQFPWGSGARPGHLSENLHRTDIVAVQEY